MPRQLKPQPLGFHEPYNLEIRVEYFLDRNTHQFFAHFGGEKYEAESKDKLIQQLDKAIKDASDIIWSPAIEVQELAPSLDWQERQKDQPFVGFKVRRLYWGRRMDGKYVQGAYEATDQQRNQNHHYLGWGSDKEVTLPYQVTHYSGTHYYLPYQEEVWLALNQLQQNILQVRRVLRQLLGTEEGVGRLVQMLSGGMLALPPANEEEAGQ